MTCSGWGPTESCPINGSSWARINAVGEMIRLGGARLDSVVLIGADKSDDSLGVMDPEQPPPVRNHAWNSPSDRGKCTPASGDGAIQPFYSG